MFLIMLLTPEASDLRRDSCPRVLLAFLFLSEVSYHKTFRRTSILVPCGLKLLAALFAVVRIDCFCL